MKNIKKIISIFICATVILSICVTAFASSKVPSKVIDSSSSVVRIFAENDYSIITGSSFVINTDDYRTLFATNYHVIDNSPKSIQLFVNGRFYDAKVVAYNVYQDLCILEVPGKLDAKALKVTEKCELGDPVYAIGFPGDADLLGNNIALGSNEVTLTDGIISAIRSLTLQDGGSPVKILQINVDINHGNSGGPLLDDKGQVVGINTYGVSNGINGAIAASELLLMAKANNIDLNGSSNNVLQTVGLIVIVLYIAIGLFFATKLIVDKAKIKSKVKIIFIVLLIAILLTTSIMLVSVAVSKICSHFYCFKEANDLLIPKQIVGIIDPEYIDYINAGILLQQGKYDEAEAAARKLSGKYSSGTLINECMYRQARLYLEQGNYISAMPIVENLMDVSYKNSKNLYSSNVKQYLLSLINNNEQERLDTFLYKYNELGFDIKTLIDLEVMDAAYNKAVVNYKQGRFSFSLRLLNTFFESEYKDSQLLKALCAANAKAELTENEFETLKNGINSFNTKQVILQKSSIAMQFLRGIWKDTKGNAISFTDKGIYTNFLPENTKCYIYNGKLQVIAINKGVPSVKSYDIYILGPNIISIRMYNGNGSLTAFTRENY